MVFTGVWTLIQNEYKCLGFLRIDFIVSVSPPMMTVLSCTATLSSGNCFSLLKEAFQLSGHRSSGKKAAEPFCEEHRTCVYLGDARQSLQPFSVFQGWLM